MFIYSRSCAWGQFRNEAEPEKKDDAEKVEGEEAPEKEATPPPSKDKVPDFDFVVSGGLVSGQESPEVKVWQINNDKLQHIHSLPGHSLGIVSVDVSPNGKCKKIKHPVNRQKTYSEYF